MKSRSLFPGILLITLGILFVGRNYGLFHLDWSFFSRFWPVLLILAGIHTILKRQQSSAVLITTVLLGVAVPLAIISAFRANDWGRGDRHDRHESHGDWHDSEEEEEVTVDEENERDYRLNVNHFTEPMSADIQEARLSFGSGAGKVKIGATSDSLIEADTRVTLTNYSMSVNRESQVADIDLKLKDNELNIKSGKFENVVDLKLNTRPIWSFDVDFGAGQADLDLSPYLVRSVKLDAGAADIDLKLGDRSANTDVDIESGVASVTIKVPKSAGCQVESKGALNVKKFDGLSEVGDGLFQTPDFDKATKKIIIRYEGGMSRLKVERY